MINPGEKQYEKILEKLVGYTNAPFSNAKLQQVINTVIALTEEE